MMRASFKVGPRAIVEADGSTVKEVFERLAVLAPVLAHADRCGLCGGTRVVPNMRLPQGFTYYELACLSCGARLPLGQTKEGGVLFPKTRNDDHTPKPNGGWERWDGNGGEQPLAPAPTQRRPRPGQP